MDRRPVFDDDARCCAWLDRQMGIAPSLVKTAIGWEEGGELTAVVVFDNMTDSNVFAHCANTGSGGFPVELLAACYAFAFHQMGLLRVSLLIPDGDPRVLRFVEKWGAEFEARLARATKAHDMLIYVMWRDTEPAREFFRAAMRAER